MTTQPSQRARVRRKPDRAAYDRATIDAILDEALTCHVGFVRDGAPVVIPTIHARAGDVLYLHGSPAAGFLKAARDGIDVCVSVAIIDALVLARSAMHHSMDYRSVVVHGRAELVTGPDELLHAFEAIVEHVAPGRWPHLRPVTDEDIRQTAVVSLPLDEASAKIRDVGVSDDAADLDLPIWAGVVPLRTEVGQPVTDAGVPDGIEVPDHVRSYRRSRTTASL